MEALLRSTSKSSLKIEFFVMGSAAESQEWGVLGIHGWCFITCVSSIAWPGAWKQLSSWSNLALTSRLSVMSSICKKRRASHWRNKIRCIFCHASRTVKQRKYRAPEGKQIACSGMRLCLFLLVSLESHEKKIHPWRLDLALHAVLLKISGFFFFMIYFSFIECCRNTLSYLQEGIQLETGTCQKNNRFSTTPVERSKIISTVIMSECAVLTLQRCCLSWSSGWKLTRASVLLLLLQSFLTELRRQTHACLTVTAKQSHFHLQQPRPIFTVDSRVLGQRRFAEEMTGKTFGYTSVYLLSKCHGWKLGKQDFH